MRSPRVPACDSPRRRQRLVVPLLVLAALLVTLPARATVTVKLLTLDGQGSLAVQPGETFQLQVRLEAGSPGDSLGGVYYRLVMAAPPEGTHWRIEARDYAGYGWHQNDGFWDLSIPRPGYDTFPVQVTQDLVAATAAHDITLDTTMSGDDGLPAPGTHTAEVITLRAPETFAGTTYELQLADAETSTITGTPLNTTADDKAFTVFAAYNAATQLTVQPGWNAASLPFRLREGTDLKAVVVDEGGGPLSRGRIWTWDAENQVYVPLTGNYRAGTVFWFFCDWNAPVQSRIIEGLNPQGGCNAALFEGWNLVAPCEDTPVDTLTAPGQTAVSVWRWDRRRRRPISHPEGTDLLADDIYWISVIPGRGRAVRRSGE